MLSVLSGFFARSEARVPKDSTRLCRALAEAGLAEVSVDGEPQPAPFPKLPRGPWPTHPWALKELGVTQAELRESFELERRRRGALAHLPAQTVEPFVPRELWGVAARMIEDGPGLAVARAEEALWRYSREPAPANKRRPEGPRAAGSVRDLRGVFARLFRLVSGLAEREHPHPSLAGWRGAAPRVELPSGLREPERDVSAPRPEQLRLAWNDLNAAVWRALGVEENSQELAAIKAMTPSALVHCGVFRVLRDRAVILVMLLTGARIGAVADLSRADYVRGYQGPAPDYRVGVAIRLRPGKALPREEVRLKPLPPKAALIVDAYLEFLDRVSPVRRRWFGGDDSPPIPDDPPLFVSDQVNWRPFGEFGIRKVLSGAPPDRNGCGGRDALIQNTQACNPALSEAERRQVGFRPHSVRAATMQLSERAGRVWNETHPPQGGEAQPEPKLYGHALLDHKVADEALRGLYGDWDARSRRELLAGRAIEGIWRLLTTTDGSRRRPNVSLIRHTAGRLRAVEGEIAHLRACRAALNDGAPAAPPPRQVVASLEAGGKVRPHDADDWEALSDGNGAPAEGQLNIEEIARHHVHQGDAALRGISDLQVRQHEAELRQAERDRLADRIERLLEIRGELQVELHTLMRDPARFELLPDDAPAGAEQLDVDLDSLLGEAKVDRGRVSPPPPPVRCWILIHELAEIVEVSRATVDRWLHGDLPRDPRRRPWDPGRAPIDDSLGLRYRRLRVDEIKAAFWPGDAAEARLADVLAVWPAGQGWSKSGQPTARCLTPLIGADGKPLPPAATEPQLLEAYDGNTPSGGPHV